MHPEDLETVCGVDGVDSETSKSQATPLSLRLLFLLRLGFRRPLARWRTTHPNDLKTIFGVDSGTLKCLAIAAQFLLLFHRLSRVLVPPTPDLKMIAGAEPEKPKREKICSW
jgi:hypothetical protein